MGVKLSRIDVLSERLIEFVARHASRIKYDQAKLQIITGPSIARIVQDAINAVSSEVVRVRNGLLYCNLCRKGPYTKRGMYLHLIRVHRYELKLMISDELRERLARST